MIKMSSVAHVGCERSGAREAWSNARVLSMDGAMQHGERQRKVSHTDSRLGFKQSKGAIEKQLHQNQNPNIVNNLPSLLNCKRKQNVHLSLIECNLRID